MAVLDGDAAPVAEAAAWFASVSLGRCRPKIDLLGRLSPPRPFSFYAASGGKGAWPGNSQSLAADVAAALNEEQRARLRSAAGLLLCAPAGFAPHTWHIPNGGVALGAGGWLRQYSVAPAEAPLGTLAHELGHLLFDWPDLLWASSYERECLMARGAAGGRSREPSPPCAPLLLKEGWRDPLPLTPALKVADLVAPWVAVLRWISGPVLVESRGDRLLLYSAGAVPRILARIPLTPDDAGRSVLGLAAPRLRASSS